MSGPNSPPPGEPELDDQQVTVVDGVRPTLDPELAHLNVPALLDAEPGEQRYELRQLLGEGGNGRVYAAFDRDLRREIALKTVHNPDPLACELFVREARVTAGLGHPNVPPLYDVGQSNGTYYLSMQRVPGRSLGELIRHAISTGASELMPVGQIVEVMLKLSDALAYAHAQGVVHRDIKPDNVMIGAYGEVMLVDWGAAYRARDGDETLVRVIGTPAYMSPEQVIGAPPTPASDVYALGATLFHALLLRRPLDKPSSDEFWQKKTRGEFDPPTAAEAERVPRAVLSVALKAISPSPRDRYDSMSAFGQALRDFQAGRNAWAAAIVSESLEDDGYLERWQQLPAGAFERREQRLVSRGSEGCMLVHRQRLPPGVALEFDGEILPGERGGDLSVVWTDDDLFEPEPRWPKPGTSISLQIGAFDNLSAGIYRDFNQCLSGRSLSVQVGRRYRVRAEIDERMLRLFLDGELVAEYEELFPLASGYVAIFSYAPGKAFSNVKLYERGVPERVSTTAIGDAFYARSDYDHAAKQYARVEQLLPRSELAQEARFKRGLCALREGSPAIAKELWGGLRSELWRARAALHAIDDAFNAGSHQQVVDELGRLLENVPLVRASLIDRWAQYVNALCGSNRAPLERYAALRERAFPDHLASAATAAALELARGNWQLVIERYPDQHVQFVEACNALGEFERVIERYPEISWIRDMALLYMNQFERPKHKGLLGLARALRGDPQGALELGNCIEALLATGRFAEVLDHKFVSEGDRAAALRGLSRVQEAAERGDARALCQLGAGEEALSLPLGLCEELYLRHHLALAAFAAGDLDGYRRERLAAEQLPCAAYWGDVWVHRYFLLPLLERELGDEGAPERAAEQVIAHCPRHWHEKGSYLARFVLGRLSLAELEAEPVGMYRRARSLVAQALRAEFEQERAAAAELYARYLALPELERTPDSPRGDPLFERWARLRSA